MDPYLSFYADTHVEPMPFCGHNASFTDVWLGDRFGLCFREMIIGAFPFVILLFGGIYRVVQLFKARHKRKAAIVRANEVKTVFQRRWFWTKFAMSVAIALLSQFQLIDAGILKDDIIPVLVVADSLRAVGWGFIAILMYKEYKKYLAHSAMLRVFWIVNFICSLIKEHSLIADYIARDRSPVNSVFFWTYQVVLLLQLTIMIMGALGFKQSLRKKLEPNLPDKFIEKGPPGLSILAIIRQMQPDFWTMWVTGAIFAIGQGVATIIFLEYTAKAVTSIQAGAEMGEVRSALTKFAIAGVASAVGAIGSGVLFGLAGNRYVMRIRMQLLDSLMIQDMAFFDTISPGALIGHITGDTDRIGDLRDIIPKFLTPFCQVAFGAYTLFNTSWQLSLVVLALLVVEFIEASVRSKHVTHKYMRRYIKSNRGASEKATEVLASFTTVRLFGQERLEHDLYKEKTDFVKRVGAKKETLESIFQGIETMLHAAIIGLGTLYSFNLISEGLMSTESLNEFVLVGVSLITSFQDVIKTTPLAAETTGPLQVINDLITRIPRIDSNTGETIRNLQGHINFNKMSFTYPNAGTAAASAFENFNLDVPAGSSVAFVGPSGCGKSTLFKLVLRFYDPDAGSVKIDKNYDLRDLHLKWWLQNIGVVSQEAVLFKGTFRYNLLYGVQNPHEISEEQIMEACRQAQLTSLVQEKGLDFQVGDKGSSLSGGQKQRVCIARVFLRQPKILFLDEVTSALDAISESEVMKALSALMVGRTTFVIAHRLHTIVNVDHIYVLKNGSIVDHGTHKDLVDKEGFYRDMWVKQQGDRTESAAAATSATGDAEEGPGRSWEDVDTLLDLLEGANASTEVLALARRIRPPRTRLSRRGAQDAPANIFGSVPDYAGLEMNDYMDQGYVPRRGTIQGDETTDDSSDVDEESLLIRRGH